jgi:hypothetical protein
VTNPIERIVASMNLNSRPTVALFLSVFFLTNASRGQTGGGYDLSWHKISGGGGASAGGAFSLAGTIGQHDASNAMVGGGFSLAGGFWSIVAVAPTSGAPWLTIRLLNASKVKVSWPSPSTGFGLQQTPNPTSGNWNAVGLTVSDDGTTRSVIVTPLPENMFYRLVNP